MAQRFQIVVDRSGLSIACVREADEGGRDIAADDAAIAADRHQTRRQEKFADLEVRSIGRHFGDISLDHLFSARRIVDQRYQIDLDDAAQGPLQC